MGYKKIFNLYRDQNILMFKECYALEKVHGTSAHVAYDREQDKLTFFSGGAVHGLFIEFFNHEGLLEKFREFGYDKMIVYGEAYGGKLQGMRETYGDHLFFTAFEVKINDNWLNVVSAENVVHNLGIEFMPYERIPCDLEHIDRERDRPSVISEWRTGQTDKEREGVVLRPLQELHFNSGSRIVAKHKNENFSERKSKRDANPDPEVHRILEKASEIAEEWVTPMRLEHVIDKLEDVEDMTATPRVMMAMVEDVLCEAEGEIVDSKEARKAISRRTVKLLKEYFVKKLREDNG